MAQQKGRRIAHFAAGGYAGAALMPAGNYTATAQGLPAATPAGGYTPGPATNAAGSWGAAAESGGIAGDTNASPVGAPDTSAFNQPGNYVAPAAALPAAAANVAAAPTPTYSSGSTDMQASMPGGYGSPGENSGLLGAEGGAIPERMKDGGTVQNMKRGGKVRQMKPNGKPGSSQPANTPPQGRPATPPKPTPPDPDDPTGDTPQPAGQGFRAMPSAIPASPPAFDDGGAAPDPDTSDIPVDADQGQEGQAGDQSQQQSGPLPSVQKALTAARSQFGLNDSIFNNMQMSDNQNDPRPIPPSPNGPVKPFNPRDFLPGGSKASDSGQGDVASAAGGGAIPGQGMSPPGNPGGAIPDPGMNPPDNPGGTNPPDKKKHPPDTDPPEGTRGTPGKTTTTTRPDDGSNWGTDAAGDQPGGAPGDPE
jgi:hypothetical protein